ncbi:MAG: hypothetical protein H0U43_06200 [Chthoniobacterales bacterium]|nr:hypothetical protein [Chthoniobacterales bacterium]
MTAGGHDDRAAARPSRARKLFASLAVIVTVLIVWKIIDYRMQPPPPPNPVSATR